MKLAALFAPEMISITGIEIIDVTGFLELFTRFTLNTIVILLLVRWLYFSASGRKDYLFTFIMISGIVFLLCFLLESVKLQLGFALGLFAVFAIIRYRTDAIPIKEMTYLFIVIGVSVINALTSNDSSLADLLFTNGVIVFMTFGLERLWLMKCDAQKIIVYEKIQLIRPDKRDELIRDLTERTGIKKINRVETGKIDFLKDVCFLTIYYDASENPDSVNGLVNNKSNDDDD